MILNLFTQAKSHFSDLFASLQMFDGLSPIIYRSTAPILSSSLSSIMHHNGCVNGYDIKRLSDALSLYLSNKRLSDVLSLSNYLFTIRSYDLLYITHIDIRHKKHSELRGGEMNERK